MPGCALTWCRIDQDNTFVYAGKRYPVPEEMLTCYGDQQADRILAVENEKRLIFYDMNVKEAYMLKSAQEMVGAPAAPNAVPQK